MNILIYKSKAISSELNTKKLDKNILKKAVSKKLPYIISKII